MRRRKLIELLNLYIDGEITPEDQVILETEISASPEARRLYHQYCRLDDATRLVYRQFRLQAPPESLPDPVDKTTFLNPLGRLRRITLVAGSVAAVIALVSGGLVVFGPSLEGESTETITLTESENASPASVVAIVPPPVQTFGSDSSFDLQPAVFGTQVPADWKPRIEIPEPVEAIPGAPEAFPVYGGIHWVTPQQITNGFGLSNFEDARVYRGPERREGQETRQVSFQFRK
jgi:hypothetical protein